MSSKLKENVETFGRIIAEKSPVNYYIIFHQPTGKYRSTHIELLHPAHPEKKHAITTAQPTFLLRVRICNIKAILSEMLGKIT